jgi:four helix bundle protein
MKDFKKLRIWQKGLQISIGAYKLIETFPKEERFGLSSQITSAAVSIPSNIAEGSSRSSERDYSRFIEISLGSSFEFNTQLLIADALKYGNQTIRESLLQEIELENIMLQSFLLSLKKC